MPPIVRYADSQDRLIRCRLMSAMCGRGPRGGARLALETAAVIAFAIHCRTYRSQRSRPHVPRPTLALARTARTDWTTALSCRCPGGGGTRPPAAGDLADMPN